MQARDALVRPDVVTIDADETLESAARLMLQAGIRHLPVTDNRKLVGVLSERDVVAFRGYGGLRAPVAMAMAKNPETARPDEDVADVAHRMAAKKIGCMPVVDGSRLIGILTTTDILAGHVGRGPPRSPAVDVLEIPVREVMTGSPLTVHPDDRLLDAIGRMSQRGVRHLPMVDGDNRVLGMLSDRDVRRAIGDAALREGEAGLSRRVSDMRVQEVASRPALTVGDEAPLGDAIRFLIQDRVGAVAVVDQDNRVVGIVSYIDVLERVARGVGEPSGVAAMPPQPMVPATH